MNGDKRNAHRLLMRNPDERRPMGRPRRRWVVIIEADLREMGWGIEWINLVQDRDNCRYLVNSVTNLHAL
jgi:hypothetical protein